MSILYRSCVFEQEILVAGFFFRTDLGYKLSCTEHSRVAFIYKVDDENEPLEQIKSVAIGENPSFYLGDSLFLRND